MGSAGDAINATQTPEPITFLDIKLDARKTTEYVLPAGWNGTVYLLAGTVAINNIKLNNNEVVAFGSAATNEKITFTADGDSRFLLISGQPVAHA